MDCLKIIKKCYMIQLYIVFIRSIISFLIVILVLVMYIHLLCLSQHLYYSIFLSSCNIYVSHFFVVVICFQIDYYINNKNMRSCQKSIITKYRITKNIIISTIWVVKYQIYDDDYLFSYMETNWWFTSLLFSSNQTT
jgi:hypothetical protein